MKLPLPIGLGVIVAGNLWWYMKYGWDGLGFALSVTIAAFILGAIVAEAQIRQRKSGK